MGFLNWILRRLFKYLSPIITLFDNPKIKYYSNKEPKHAPVFIIGPPRSGSTILYQLITNFLDVSYIDNLIHLSRKNLFFGFWLSNRFFKNKIHNNFKSDYGNTQKFGLNAPSEGGRIWYRWFSKDKIYFETGSLSDNQINQIRNLFNAIINRYDKPVVIKNLMFSERINALYEVFPNAKLIVITRSPDYNSQSIMSARLKNPDDDWWSAKPKNYKELLNLSFTEQCVSQVYYIEKQIFEDIKQFPKQNIKTINYETLFTNCTEAIDDLKTFIGAESKMDHSDIEIRSENKVKVDKKDFQTIQEITAKYNWVDLRKN